MRVLQDDKLRLISTVDDSKAQHRARCQVGDDSKQLKRIVIYTRRTGKVLIVYTCGKIVDDNRLAEMDDHDTDYCLDFSDIVGDEEAATSVEDVDSTDTAAKVDYEDHVEILRLGLACCRAEVIAEPDEFCFMDGFTLYKGCKLEDQIQLPPKHEQLLRLDYDDVMSSWCEDRSLWTDGKRPQTVPDYFAGPTSMVPSQNDMGLVPELGSVHGSNSTSDVSGAGRGARVTRYREKKRSRLLSKTIRYEVRKVNADSRPRIKGRFVKRTSKSRE